MNYWNREAQRVFRSSLVRAGITRKRLVERLSEIGVETTEAAIANRIYRGTLSLAFVLQVAAALRLERLELGGATAAEQYEWLKAASKRAHRTADAADVVLDAVERAEIDPAATRTRRPLG